MVQAENAIATLAGPLWRRGTGLVSVLRGESPASAPGFPAWWLMLLCPAVARGVTANEARDGSSEMVDCLADSHD